MAKNSVLLLFYILSTAFAIAVMSTATDMIHIVAKSLFRGPYFSFANFVLHENSKLEVDGAAMKYAPDAGECSKGCAGNVTCFSLNFGTQPIFFIESVPQYLCELLPTDKYNSSSKFREGTTADFHHYSIQSECKNSPCPPNKTICVPNYFNDTFSCEDIDECATNSHACHPNATCNNTMGSYNCTCQKLKGLEGDGFTCRDIDECANRALHDCYNSTQCKNDVPSYHCECPPGFSGDGKSQCVAIDECNENPAICVNSICHNTPGSYNCECNKGYEKKDNLRCDDINECNSTSNPASCHTNALCSNTIGSYTCHCKTNFTGDGKSCSRTFDITVKSEDSQAVFIVDGVTRTTKDHGVNMMVLNDNEPHEAVKGFDFNHNPGPMLAAMNTYIDAIPTEKVVLLAVCKNDHVPKYKKVNIQKVHDIGSTKVAGDLENEKTWVIIGYKGEVKPFPVIELTSTQTSLQITKTIAV